MFYIAVGYGLHGSIHLSNLHEDSYIFVSRGIIGRMYNNCGWECADMDQTGMEDIGNC